MKASRILVAAAGLVAAFGPETAMAQAANRSDSLSQSELASLGYACCVELRPQG